MTMFENRYHLVAGVAAFAIVAGGGAILFNKSVFSSATTIESATPQTDTGIPADAGEEHREGYLEMTAERIEAAGIKTVTVVAGALGAEIIAQASVTASPDGEAILTARADGAITRIARRLGDPVRAGEAVAWLESRDAASIAAERSAAHARAIQARSAYTREKRLFDANVTARQDLEAAQAALGQAEAELRRAQASAAAARVSNDGRYLAVTSLISGRITRVDARLGAYALAGTELFRVADPARIQIEAAVQPADAKRISAGDRAEIELVGGTTVAATVRSATPALNPENRMATIVLIPVEGSGLAPGQGLRARIVPANAAVPADRIVLPEEAVQSVEGRDVVFVRQTGGFQATPVATGARSGERIEIIGGLRLGTIVATTGTFLLKAELGKGEAEH